MVLIVIALVVLGLLQIVSLFALVDQYRGLLQIRERLELRDNAQELQIAEGAAHASATKLPPAFATNTVTAALFLSTKCASCLSVAQSLKGRAPRGAWVVIVGAERDCVELQASVGLSDERVLIDTGGQIADQLRVRTYPSALLFVRGELSAARTVPSGRELRRVLDEWDGGAWQSTLNAKETDK